MSRAEEEEQPVVPPDAELIRNLLKSMGVKKYEPQVVHQLLNFAYRHVAEILQDAEVYMNRTGSEGEIGMEDIFMSIQSREAFSFLQPPPQNVLTEIAAQVNKEPLPKLSEKPGLIIPVNSLLGPSYQLSVEEDEELPSAQENEIAKSGSSRRDKDSGSPKIAIQLGDRMDET